MQVPHWVIRAALIVLICFFVEFFLNYVGHLGLSYCLELMEGIAQRRRTRIKPQTRSTHLPPAPPTPALIEEGTPDKTRKGIEAVEQQKVQIHAISLKTSR